LAGNDSSALQTAITGSYPAKKGDTTPSIPLCQTLNQWESIKGNELASYYGSVARLSNALKTQSCDSQADQGRAAQLIYDYLSVKSKVELIDAAANGNHEARSCTECAASAYARGVMGPPTPATTSTAR
jgi:hypothetical protein